MESMKGLRELMQGLIPGDEPAMVAAALRQA